MITPVRIQRRRVRGFDVQAASRAINGLPARYVGRPTVFGNPVSCAVHGCELVPCGCCEPYRCCVKVFREYLLSGLENRSSCTGSFWIAVEGMAGYPYRAELVRRLPELAGHNLACWCPPDRPCHADVLLEFANRVET